MHTLRLVIRSDPDRVRGRVLSFAEKEGERGGKEYLLWWALVVDEGTWAAGSRAAAPVVAWPR